MIFNPSPSVVGSPTAQSNSDPPRSALVTNLRITPALLPFSNLDFTLGLQPDSRSTALGPSSIFPQMMTVARHGIFKPKQLFNLNSICSSIYALPKNPLQALRDPN